MRLNEQRRTWWSERMDLAVLALPGWFHDVVHHLHIVQVPWRAFSSKSILIGRAPIFSSTLVCCLGRTWSIFPPAS